MKKSTKIWLGVLGGAVLVGGTGTVMALRGNDGSSDYRTVEVTRDSLVQKALAVGNIEPDVEIAVKSQISGVVRTLFVEEGAFVKTGEPLLEVAPNPTPIELADSKRQVELREIELVNLLKDVERKRELRSRDFVTQEELDRAERDIRAVLKARLQLIASTGKDGGPLVTRRIEQLLAEIHAMRKVAILDL